MMCTSPCPPAGPENNRGASSPEARHRHPHGLGGSSLRGTRSVRPLSSLMSSSRSCLLGSGNAPRRLVTRLTHGAPRTVTRNLQVGVQKSARPVYHVASAPRRQASVTSSRGGMMEEAVVWEAPVVVLALERRFRVFVASQRERA